MSSFALLLIQVFIHWNGNGFHSWSIALSLKVESCVAADAGLILQYSNRFSLMESTFSADSPNPMLCDQLPCPVETVASQALAAIPFFGTQNQQALGQPSEVEHGHTSGRGIENGHIYI